MSSVCDPALECLRSASEPMTARQIAEAIGVRPYKVNHSLTIMVKYGLVRRAGTVTVGTNPNTSVWEAVQ